MVFSISCSSKPIHEPSDIPSAVDVASAVSHWVFHPLAKGSVTDSLVLDSSTNQQVKLEVDVLGSRWLSDADGEDTASPFGAPEALISVSQASGKFVFVGKSGAVYFSQEPLGPFTEVRTPPEPFVHTRQFQKTLVSVSRKGALQRSVDWGQTWQTVDSSEFFVDMGQSSDGSLLAWSVPEQWHLSSDGGKSFRKQKLPSISPIRIYTLNENELVVDGLLSSFRYENGEFRRIAQPRASLLGADSLLSRREEDGSSQDRKPQSRAFLLPRFASASALLSARASLDGDTYQQLNPAPPSEPWSLARAQLGMRAQHRKMEGMEDCAEFLFSAGGNNRVAICDVAEEREVAPRLSIFQGSPADTVMKRWEEVHRGKLDRVLLTLSQGGQIAIGGLCSGKEPAKGCSASGLLLVSKGGTSRRIHLPGVDNPQTIAFGKKGELWAAGFRQKDGHVIVYGPLGLLGADRKYVDLTRQLGWPEEGIGASGAQAETRRGRARGRIFGNQRTSGAGSIDERLILLPGALGVTSLVYRAGKDGYVAAFDSNGELWGSGHLPRGVRTVHGAGLRLLASAPETGVLWESETAGMAWTARELPRAICEPGDTECSARLYCSDKGCLVGDELTRIGWGDSDSFIRSKLVAEKSLTNRREKRAEISCSLGNEDWMELPGLVAIPSVQDAALGESAWAQVQMSLALGAVVALRAQVGEKKIRSQPLFPSPSKLDEFFYQISPQVEGAAVFRYRKSPNSAGIKLEIAWDNRIEGIQGRGSTMTSRQKSTLSSSRNWAENSGISPELMSVAGRGLYLRALNPAGVAVTQFLSTPPQKGGVEVLPDVRWPSIQSGTPGRAELVATLRAERVRIQGEHVALLLMAGNRLFIRAGVSGSLGEKKQGTSDFHPYQMGLFGGAVQDIAQQVAIAYRGTAVGFLSTFSSLEGDFSHARFVELGDKQPFLAPVPVPTQLDLKEDLVPCGKREREMTVRVVAPSLANTSRIVTIAGLSGGGERLQTQKAVLFGSPAQPCVAVLEAVGPEATELQYRALIGPGKEAVSWIFRTKQTSSGGHSTSARTLSCRQEEWSK